MAAMMHAQSAERSAVAARGCGGSVAMGASAAVGEPVEREALPKRVSRVRLLRPTPGSRTISRPRIYALLNAQPDARIVAVTAPAGFGKTTAVAAWVERSGRPVAWLTLDDVDDRAPRLAESLVAAMRTVRPGWGSGLGALFEAEPPLTGGRWGEAIAAEIIAGAPDVTLVLDDVHVLTDRSSLDLLWRLAAATPGRLVLVSRLPAPIDRAALLAAGQLVEVAADDLRFDREETGCLAGRVVDSPLSAEGVDRALSITGGWPAALRLLLAAGGSVPEADVLASIDWLVAGALAQAPSILAERLLYGSIASNICDGLLDAALPPAPALPSFRLEDAGPWLGNLLIATYEGGEWRRLHPLVRETLERQLREREGAGAIAAAHSRVARWFASVGMVESAVQHALRGNQPDLAGRIVEEAGFAALNRERWDLVAGYLETLPPGVQQSRSGLVVLASWRQYHRGFDQALGPHQIAAARLAVRDLSAAAGGDPDLNRYLAHLDIHETYVLDPVPSATDLIARTEGILEHLGRTDDTARGILLGTTGIATGLAEGADVGLAYLATALQSLDPARVGVRVNVLSAQLVIQERCGGQGIDRAAALAEIHRLGAAHDLRGSATWAAIGSGWMALARLEVDEARWWFDAAMRLESSLAVHVWRWARGGMALAAVLAGHGDEADVHAAEILRSVEVAHLPLLTPNSQSFQARIWLLQRRHERVREWLERTQDIDDWRSFLLRESSGLTRVRAMMAYDPAGEDPAVAAYLAHLQSLTDAPDAAAWIWDGLLICEAGLLVRQGRHGEALDRFLPVAQGAAGRGDLLAVVEYGDIVRPLIELAARGGLDPAYAARALEEIDRLDHLWPNPLRMTERECAVLALLAEPLTLKEVAERLYIAAATARVHSANIYRRLGVSKRREAVARGRALGLIADPDRTASGPSGRGMSQP